MAEWFGACRREKLISVTFLREEGGSDMQFSNVLWVERMKSRGSKKKSGARGTILGIAYAMRTPTEPKRSACRKNNVLPGPDAPVDCTELRQESQCWLVRRKNVDGHQLSTPNRAIASVCA